MRKIKIKYYDDGQKLSEDWLIEYEEGLDKGFSENDRCDGPAYRSWYKNGQKKYEFWFIGGELHREDGPADQEWYINGQKQVEEWYLNGKLYSRREWIKKLKEIGSEHYREQKMLYDAEKYNL